MAPYLVKLATNALVAATASPLYLGMLFGAFGMSQVLRTYIDGSRIRINGQITKFAFLDVSTRVFESLLSLDL